MASSMLEKMENSQQSSTPSPGWNDPPPTNATILPTSNAGSNNNNRLHLQRLRRPVDPSVQGGPTFQTASSPQHNTTTVKTAVPQPQQELAAPNVHFHQSRSFPQLHAPGPAMAAMLLGSHPGSAFSPASAAAHLLANTNTSQSQSSLVANGQQQYFAPAAANPLPPQMATILHHPPPPHPHSHPNLPMAAVVSPPALPPPSMAPNLPPLPGMQQSIVPQQPAGGDNATILGHNPHHQPHYENQSLLHLQQQPNPPPALPLLPAANYPPGAGAFLGQGKSQSLDAPQQQQQQPQMAPGMMVSTTIAAAMANGSEEQLINGQQQQHSMIFSPPNIVPLKGLDQQCRPTTQPMPNNYRMPVKAAGDVSLSGAQLVTFLTKATLLIQQGPTREGIQLRINQFREFTQAGQISEPCLKKLNFVVDAIDRYIYDEAQQFFDQMSLAYPGDCALGGWAHGVRLLIQELRKSGGNGAGQQTMANNSNRAHSAGARPHFG